ncbi:hypothetical protein [Ammoniphilus resinae]|uniref:Uncharacterized protein n=1 Tax=Ammoniphilus resinae TaxID=861532 RepID=A0ABS4GNJ6_9BACL|nr:hypothetical protein [Ammoniphilus resinae]MBP1931848.1 hypothetical protein [Ammoniphilus resinae]
MRRREGLSYFKWLLLLFLFLVPFTFLGMYVDFSLKGREGLLGYKYIFVCLLSKRPIR